MLRLSPNDSHSLPSFNSGRGKNRHVAKQAYECLSDAASSFPQSMLPSPPSQYLLFFSKTTIFMTSKHFFPSSLLPHVLSPKHFSTPSKCLFPSLSSKPIPKNHSFLLKTNGFSSLPSSNVYSPSPSIFLFSVNTGKNSCCLIVYSPTGVAITSAGMKKCDLFLANVNIQLKFRNVTTDIKVDTSFNVPRIEPGIEVLQLFITITVDEPAPGLKAIFGFKVPDQRSGKFGNFTNCNAGLSFTNADLIASLALHVVMNEKGDSTNASYYHIVNPSTNIVVGAEVTHSFSTNVNTITVGTQHALDPLTTIKARVNNASMVSALIQHEWLSKSLFTIYGEVDTESIDKSPKVGLALALKP
ncbi:hypothetical protein Gotur_026663 [Gossypium turneri]